VVTPQIHCPFSFTKKWLIKRLIEWEYYNQQQIKKEETTMRQITEFVNEEGFELKGYISQLFEQVSEDNNEES
jgi:hypothetical protein